MRKVKYPFVIYPAQEGGYVAEVPALKGCLAQGDTLEETLDELATDERLPNVKREINRVKECLAA